MADFDLDEDVIATMKVRELQDELRKRSLPIGGRKSQLCQRLLEHIKKQREDEEREEEALASEEDEADVDEDHDNSRISNEKETSTTNTDLNLDDNMSVSSSILSAKTLLKDLEKQMGSQDSISLISFPSTSNPSATQSSKDSKTIKLNDSSPMSIKDRKKRFQNIDLDLEQRLRMKRKRRFGQMNGSTNAFDDIANSSSQTPQSKRRRMMEEGEKILKRADRFGTKVPKTVPKRIQKELAKKQNIDIKEQLLKRHERFGTQLPKALARQKFLEENRKRRERFEKIGKGATMKERKEFEGLKRKRAERFGTLSTAVEREKIKKRRERFG